MTIHAGDHCAWRVRLAETVGARMRGLVGRPPLGPGEGLLLVPASQVHTFGMSYAIDVVFCDRDMRVLRVLRSLPPRRVSLYLFRARSVLELPAGAAAGVAAGDQLSFKSR